MSGTETAYSPTFCRTSTAYGTHSECAAGSVSQTVLSDHSTHASLHLLSDHTTLLLPILDYLTAFLLPILSDVTRLLLSISSDLTPLLRCILSDHTRHTVALLPGRAAASRCPRSLRPTLRALRTASRSLQSPKVDPLPA
eukprot:410095-Rhodomonas_salina.2